MLRLAFIMDDIVEKILSKCTEFMTSTNFYENIQIIFERFQENRVN